MRRGAPIVSDLVRAQPAPVIPDVLSMRHSEGPCHVAVVTPRMNVGARVTTLLEGSGFVVVRARDAAELFRQTGAGEVDAIVLDAAPPFQDTVNLCREITASPRIDPATAVVVLSPDIPSRGSEEQLLSLGAWDFIRLGGSGRTLVLKLRAFTRAKRALDRVKGTSLLDAETDLYNMRGIIRRIREDSAAADRYEGALACAVLGVGERGDGAGPSDGWVREVAMRLREVCRASDVVGRLGDGLLTVAGPGTGPADAPRMVARILEHLDDGIGARSVRSPIKVGYAAVENVHLANLNPVEVLTRALRAFQAIEDDPDQRIAEFSEGLPSYRDKGLLKLLS
jgi:PleD family two-component response regulator